MIKQKAIQLTDIIVKECEDIEAIELAKKRKNEMGVRNERFKYVRANNYGIKIK